MTASADSLTAAPAKAGEPSPLALLFIFWTAFAAAVVAMRTLNPAMFERLDPDSLMRLVEVRDLIGGQAWFDLVQHRLDPPDGVLMHWSRLIDAPLAGLLIVGELLGLGEAFALTAWPLLMLLALMAAMLAVATALAGRAAVVPALILSLVFFDPLLYFLPGNIDHHDLQLALVAALVASALRMRERPEFGLLCGALAAFSLAIGLEMVPYIAIVGAFVATRWAFANCFSRDPVIQETGGVEAAAAHPSPLRGGWPSRSEGRVGAYFSQSPVPLPSVIGDRDGLGVILFGLAFGIAPALLYIVAGSPAAAVACDSLSWAYAAPTAFVGLGLTGAVAIARGEGPAVRLAALAVVAATGATLFARFFPECLAGPYGFLAPEVKALWLNTVAEAQPVASLAAREPIGTIATLGPPTVALGLALLRIRRHGPASGWTLPAIILLAALAMSFYQARTLPLANATAIPILAAWLAGERAARPAAASWVRRVLPFVAALLIALPAVHLALGWTAVRAAAALSGGRIAPQIAPDAPAAEAAGLTAAEKDCTDASSAALFAAVPPGLVVAPVFYGSAVLANAPHSVVGAPYHRGGRGIVDSIHAMDLAPAAARKVFSRRGVDYLAICATSQETAITAAESPHGLLATLVAGGEVDWLAPIVPPQPTALKLWRVRD
jgi:hypothetical protein